MNNQNKILSERYILKESIGHGGMADVYLGEDTILKRTVAIKIMRSSLTGNPIYVTRFHREASAAASLSHKNIVEIYDVGQDEDDYYIVMEYVPGQTLKDLIHKRGALHYVEAIDILKQISSAVSKAHLLGIIHRDLKPQNIMVMDSGVAKIMDFGIASIQSLSQVTQTDTIMGSLHYLAPEIARGEKASPQSDIYALGIILYELLVGDVPFNGESPVNIALKHMRDEIPSVCAFNSSIPQSVENVIIKATAKNTKDRYEKASDMFDDLSTCLLREDEAKLVFEHQDDQETIVAKEKDFFTKKEESEEININEKPKKKIIPIVSAIILAIIIFVMIYFIFLKPANNFRMPNVVGMLEDEGVSILVDNGLVLHENIRYELSDEFDEGYIIATNPSYEEAVVKGDEVIITISSGKYIVVNNYIGEKYEDIQLDLEAIGYKLTINEVVSDQDQGIIIDQSIEAGEKINPAEVSNKKMTITVSKGYEQIVPNVYGQEITKAKKILEDAGFVVDLKVLTPPTDTNEIQNMKINIVMNQSVDAFTVVHEKYTRITLEYYDKILEIIDTPDDDSSTNENTNDETNE